MRGYRSGLSLLPWSPGHGQHPFDLTKGSLDERLHVIGIGTRISGQFDGCAVVVAANLESPPCLSCHDDSAGHQQSLEGHRVKGRALGGFDRCTDPCDNDVALLGQLLKQWDRAWLLITRLADADDGRQKVSLLQSGDEQVEEATAVLVPGVQHSQCSAVEIRWTRSGHKRCGQGSRRRDRSWLSQRSTLRPR